MFTAYVLYSEKYEKHYSGYSSDILQRIQSHNFFSNKDWTKRFRQWKIIHTKNFDSKTEAIRYERWLKSGKGREFIKQLPH